MLGGQTLKSVQFTGRDKAAEKRRWHQREQQRDTTRQQKRYAYILHSRLHQLWFIEDLFQSHHGQQRDRKLSNHEDRGDGTELVVHRYIVEEEVGKAHEVLTP